VKKGREKVESGGAAVPGGKSYWGVEGIVERDSCVKSLQKKSKRDFI